MPDDAAPQTWPDGRRQQQTSDLSLCVPLAAGPGRIASAIFDARCLIAFPVMPLRALDAGPVQVTDGSWPPRQDRASGRADERTCDHPAAALTCSSRSTTAGWCG